MVIGENVYNDDGHFAGSDPERILDFQKALDDNSISAIWCARGGYGAMRVIDNLNFEKYKENPNGLLDILILQPFIMNYIFKKVSQYTV